MDDENTEHEFQLRRIGQTATCPGVVDIMRLKLGVTSFGRGDGCDFYLDSKVLKNFISRKHAEIHAEKNADGEVDYVLHHKGLNGTFVNDIKASQIQRLSEGDKVTFGHKNGYNLKAGQFASQPLSEFQYIFERCKGTKNKSESVDNKKKTNDNDSHIDLKDQKSPKKKNSPKKNDTVKDVITKTNVQKLKQDRTYLGTNNSAVSRSHTSTSSSSSSIVIPSSDDEENSSVSYHGNKENDRTKVSPNKKFDLSRNDTITYGKSPPTGKNKEQSVTKIETPTDSDNLKNNSTKRKSSNYSKKNSSVDDDDEIDLPSPYSDDDSNSDDSGDDDAEDDDDDDDDVDERVNKNKKSSDPFKMNETKATNGRRKSIGSAITKKTHSNLIGPPKKPLNIKSNKRKAPQRVSNGRKGKKIKRGRSKKNDDSEESEDSNLEDGVEWYEEEECAASDCRRPKNKRLGWVQCDDCDNWYHTECVGCRYEHVKDSNIKFSCGCR